MPKGVYERKVGWQDNKKNHRWSGGITYKNGYRWIRRKEHPYADVKGYVAEHRLVMEKHLGRFPEK